MAEDSDNSMDEWTEAMAEQSAADNVADSSGDDEWDAAFAEQKASGEKLSQPELQQFQEESQDGNQMTIQDASLEVILDIPVTISMEVGKTKISIRNLLKLNQGSVVELDRLAGEPLDVLVNGTLIAHGEVVVVNEKYGIRLTDVISAAERIQKLK
ncbi:MAG: flagellar motor switch protein FliN [Gammaproteobacteria bacterium]|jgi:flagellar motor switch protein FliN/FliY|nr:flagellar motor switch protein FliN [Gammaproteobacteria bacterium]